MSMGVRASSEWLNSVFIFLRPSLSGRPAACTTGIAHLRGDQESYRSFELGLRWPEGPTGVGASRADTVGDGYFIVPPSLHPSGAVYRFVPGRAPWEIEIAELPLEAYMRLLAAATARWRWVA
jgi:hypothetical protein